MADYIPNPDDQFHPWFTDFNAWCVDNGVTYGLTSVQVGAITNAYDPWNTCWGIHNAAQTAARSATMDKDTKRADAEPLIRAAVGVLQKSALMTDAVRATLHITVPDATRTRSAVPTTRPIAMIDTSQRLRHTINFKDETTPNSKKKPDGVMGAEIWCYIGANPPADASACSFVALDTSTPYVVEYSGADANKVAHYLLRWVNTRGEKGPWSETASATIGA